MIDPGEETVVCPYNKAHCIIKSRMHFHLTKCRQQFEGLDKTQCPFNSTHIVNKVELKLHQELCPDRVVLDNFMYKLGSRDVPQGAVEPIKNFNIVPAGDDDWDQDKSSVSVLDEVKESALRKNVLINLYGAPKAERKSHRLNERLRYQEMSGNTSQGQSSSKPSEAPSSSSNDHNTNYYSSQNAGPRPSNTPVDNLKKPITLSEQMNNLDVREEKREPQPPQAKPNAWGVPIPRAHEEKITFPTDANTSGAKQPTARNMGNPWGRVPPQTPSNTALTPITVSNSSSPARPPSTSTGTGMPRINNAWGRGLNMNNDKSEFNMDDFPTLGPLSSRGGRR